MYTKTSNHMKVTVYPFYLDQESEPNDDHYVWAYTVQVENLRSDKVQLINRHWHITDGNGQVQQVDGPGVIGEQPSLDPGEAFQYTSGTALPTPSGIMVGSYEMESDQGQRFSIEIPAFSLDSPYQTVRPN